MYWTLTNLGKNLTDTVATRRDATLVTSGPYHFVRHPFYVTAALLMAGVALLSANWFIGACGLAGIVLLVARTPKEEEKLVEKFGDPEQLDRYQTFFLDSITQLSRQCFAWCKTQPGATSDRSGKPDLRAAYGLLGQEMISALTHLQHARGKNVVFVAILDERLDDYNRKVFVPQIEGSKTSLELPGIVDEVVTLAEIKADDGSAYRAFITHTVNPYGFPAKDRSGRLDLLEPPHLGALIAKCAGTPTAPATTQSHESQE